MKYVDTQVTFSEVPDEISLSITISNCGGNCAGCHSSHLRNDIGEQLTIPKLLELIKANEGITCVCFLGGNDLWELKKFSAEIHKLGLKVAWYTSQSTLNYYYDLSMLDYIKVGPYIKERGGLDSPKTNQRMYKIEDITHKFWKHEDKS